MKIALAQLNYRVGDFSGNSAKIIAAIGDAKTAGADLAVFSELSVCGYPPKDLLFQSAFIEACADSVKKIAKECSGIAAIVGSPVVNKAQNGKPFFNAALLLSDGNIIAERHKTLIPNYDIFDECRYFEPAGENTAIDYMGYKIGLTICEDIWNQIPDARGRYLYHIHPLMEFARSSPHCIINISASPFSYNHIADRENTCKAGAAECNVPLFYLNTLGCNTDLIFDGGSMVVDKDSHIASQMEYFKEELSIYELLQDRTVNVLNEKRKQNKNTDRNEEQLIKKALVMGVRDYFVKSNLKRAVVGLSGGIDSAVVLALAAEALGADNVLALMLPSRYTSRESVKDAADLTKNIGCDSQSISIEPAYESITGSLSEIFENKPADITEENIQSRIRGMIIMAVCNKNGAVMLNTSNKSELATGYGTLYGDMSGALSVLGDIYKTQIYRLAKYMNKQRPGLIPEDIITRAPTAELKDNQKDTDSLPEYDVLDKILFQYIDEQLSPGAIHVAGADNALIKKIVAMVDRNEFKRRQFCPILRVTGKAFGDGRRIPVVAKHS